jgi:hypothetical protein
MKTGIMALALLLLAAGGAASARQAWNVGATDGDNVTAELGPDGTFTVRGIGKMRVDVEIEAPVFTVTDNRPWRGDASAITKVVIENGVTSVGGWAFYECKNLKSVTVAASVAVIGEMAFFGCDSLKSVTIPGSVTYIGDKAFYAAGLTSITVPGSAAVIGKEAFANCANLKSAVISDGAVSVGEKMFEYCTRLASVTIPASAASVGRGAFSNCSALKTLTVLNPVPPQVGKNAFEYVNTATCALRVPKGSGYSSAEGWNEFKKIKFVK